VANFGMFCLVLGRTYRRAPLWFGKYDDVLMVLEGPSAGN
jgi:hypothetical protein